MTTIVQIPRAAEPVAKNPLRYNTLYGGRGSGKSWTIAELLSAEGASTPLRILCGREIQKSLDESVLQLLKDTHSRMDLSAFYTEKKGGIYGLNGTQFIFRGLKNESVDSLKSLEGIDRVWLEEAHVLSARSLRVLIPTIRKPGSRFYVSLNPELDDDPAYERFVTKRNPERSHAIRMNWRDNPWFMDGELNEERLTDYAADNTPDKHVYNWIWEGQTLPAVEGAIFANEVSRFQQENRHRLVDYDPMGRVHVIMDLGWGVMTGVLAQRFGSTVMIIGYKEARNYTYERFFEELKADYPEWRWGKVFMPHDAQHRDPKTGTSHEQVVQQLGWKTEAVPQEGVENYIEKGRRLFRTCYINTGNDGADLMRCLKRFKYMVNANNPDKRTGVDKDDFSHGAEAFCYTAVVADRMTNQERVITNPYEGWSGYAG